MVNIPHTDTIIIESDEVTLKDLIGKATKHLIELKKNWLLVVLCCVPFASYMVYKAVSTPKQYQATMTFMVNSGEGGSGLAGAASILSSLGVAGPENDNLEKILALSKSMRIVNEVLLTKATIDGHNDYIGNHIIKKYDFYGTSWKTSKELQGFVFKSANIDSFSLLERGALKALYSKVLGGGKVEGLITSSQSRLTQIMTIVVSSISDDLSVVLSQVVFDKLSAFYIEKTVQRERETFKLIKQKADSIKRALTGADFSAAKFEDTNRGLFMETIKIPTKQLGRDVNRLTIMYAEAVKNLEISDFALKNKTPYIQVVDMPFSPLPSISVSWKSNLITGALIGALIGMLFVIFRKIIRDSMAG
jgi:transcriptional regulator CtsR